MYREGNPTYDLKPVFQRNPPALSTFLHNNSRHPDLTRPKPIQQQETFKSFQPTSTASGMKNDDDEFSDFQSGILDTLPAAEKTISSASTKPISFIFSPIHTCGSGSKLNSSGIQNEVGSRLANYNLGFNHDSKPPKDSSLLIGDEDKYSALRVFLQNEEKDSLQGTEVEHAEDDDYGDFQSFGSKEQSQPDVLSMLNNNLSASLLPTRIVETPIIEQHSANDDFGDFVSCQESTESFPSNRKEFKPVRLISNTKVESTSDEFGLNNEAVMVTLSSSADKQDRAFSTLDHEFSTHQSIAQRKSLPPENIPRLRTTLISMPTNLTSSDPRNPDSSNELNWMSNPAPQSQTLREAITNTADSFNVNEVETYSEISLGNLITGRLENKTITNTNSVQKLSITKQEEVISNKDLKSVEQDDKYSVFKIEQQKEGERCRREWRRCLETCLRLIEEGANIFNSASSSKILRRVARSEKGSIYIRSLLEVYFVAFRVYHSWIRFGLGGEENLGHLHQRIALAWDVINTFLLGTDLQKEVQKHQQRNSLHEASMSRDRACGICLLGTDPLSPSSDDGNSIEQETALDFGGKLYHLPCANLWVNEINDDLPALMVI